MSPRFDRQYQTRARILTTILSVGLGILAACGPSQSAQHSTRESDNKVTPTAQDTTVKRYKLTGRVVSIDKPAHSISVDGDAIPGFMAAMTMPYQVKDAEALDKVSPGDQIKAEIVMADDGVYLDNIVSAPKTSSPKSTK